MFIFNSTEPLNSKESDWVSCKQLQEGEWVCYLQSVTSIPWFTGKWLNQLHTVTNNSAIYNKGMQQTWDSRKYALPKTTASLSKQIYVFYDHEQVDTV